MTDQTPSMLDLVIELHKPLDRLGPGSAESTNRALDFIEGLGSMERVLDLGCGTGAQTMTLAERISGSITGIDLFSDFVDELNAQAEKRGLSDRVRGVQGSMGKLDAELEASTSFGARAQLTASGSRRCSATGALSSSRMATWPLRVRRGLLTIA